LDELKYKKCEMCVGKEIDEDHILSPCLRKYPEGFEYPNDCSKKARGIIIPNKSNWIEISEEEFFVLWDFGMKLQPRIHLYEDGK